MNYSYTITKIHIWYDGPQFCTMQLPIGDFWAIALEDHEGQAQYFLWSKNDPANEIDTIREVQMASTTGLLGVLNDDGMTIDCEPLLGSVIPEFCLIGAGSGLRLSFDGAQDNYL